MCPFCEEFKDPSSFKKIIPSWPYTDRIIFKNENAMAFPGIGPIAPNRPYVLVIPKSCSPSFLMTSQVERMAMFDIFDQLLTVEAVFPCKYLFVFEHGGSVGNSGCKCIDHCHMHVMSIDGPWVRLPDMLGQYHLDKQKIIKVDTQIEGPSYLFTGFYQKNSRFIDGRLAVLHNCREPQFFRALIGNILGCDFDYRLNENVDSMIKTYNSLR